ncbi:zinc finger protein 32-like [Cheilinus undulatus]|uniref:zinc finger protein 32-like n=1 Tax=Cheilinus undulatus TaxID=241271 RepID=UPI001BD233A8|nr:zinc finger protein 32-like [Cheilinus undulatus]
MCFCISDFPMEVQQLPVHDEEVLREQQEQCSSQNQVVSIKEEPEELWSSQEGEQHQGSGLAGISMFTFVPIPVKSEYEEKPQFSQHHHRQSAQMETGADKENNEGAEATRYSDLERDFKAETEVKTEDCSEAETDDSSDWNETPENQSGLNSVENIKASECRENDIKEKTETKPVLKQEDCGGSEQARISDSNSSAQPLTELEPTPCVDDLTETHEQQAALDFMEKKLHSCSECAKRFTSKKSLKGHMRTHSGKKPFSCSECNKVFGQKDFLTTHKKIHTREKPFSCSGCDRKFHCKGNLLAHMRIHTGEKPFVCSICGKQFRQKGTMNLHMRIHKGEKPFSCSECDRKFHCKGNLLAHMRIHTGEKPFSCFICSKQFRHKGTMNVHMRIHSLNKHMSSHKRWEPLSCPECDRKFSYPGNLSKHMVIHEGENPFSCSECGKKFSLKDDLKQHMFTHTVENPTSRLLPILVTQVYFVQVSSKTT